MDGTERLAKEWSFAGGAFNNRDFYSPNIRFSSTIKDEQQMVLFDPQTSGGLLFSVAYDETDACLDEAKVQGISLWKIGEVTDSGRIEVF